MPIDPVALAAALIQKPSVTPQDEGAIGLLSTTLEGLGFTCHVVEFTEAGTAPILPAAPPVMIRSPDRKGSSLTVDREVGPRVIRRPDHEWRDLRHR